VKHSRDGKRAGIVIGRLDADGRRFVASGDDDELLALLTSGEPVGARVYTLSFGTGNRVTTSDARMRELYPPEPLALRDR
jgi:acetyl-CoA C-acetyltransferase